jgi:hypothetical protein
MELEIREKQPGTLNLESILKSQMPLKLTFREILR